MRPADIQRLEAELSDPLTVGFRVKEIAYAILGAFKQLVAEFAAYREWSRMRIVELEARLDDAERRLGRAA